ncbi:flavodoxin [Sulfurospirillum arsenophilum]|uniref:flavodoxin n=1 Tax=Sulfurospirillum arsenophilum TaxID=56698 RepID=UPI000A009970|nr:flavodoxin [Sulfurospirillum arsenophilum]
MVLSNTNKRRNFLITSAALAAGSLLPHELFAEESTTTKKILIAYFSHSGNTRYFAKEIQAQIGGDLLEIKTVNPYPVDYDSVVDVAKKEQKAKFRPKLATLPTNLNAYDIIFIGYPNWWGTIPMALFTFFEENHFEGKTLIPFSTHEGSHFGDSISDLKALNPKSTFFKGLEMRGRSVQSSSSKKDITAWLTKLNIAKI